MLCNDVHPLKALFSIFLILSGRFTSVNLSHPQNNVVFTVCVPSSSVTFCKPLPLNGPLKYSSIPIEYDTVVKLLGIVSSVNFEQPSKTRSPNFVRPNGNCISCNSLQFTNALPPILCNFVGNCILFKDMHPLNAAFPIFLMLSGKCTSVNFSHPLNKESGTVSIPSSNVTFFNPLSPNAPMSVVVKLLGIVISVNFLQRPKTSIPNSSRLGGNCILCNDVQPQNASLSIFLILSGT